MSNSRPQVTLKGIRLQSFKVGSIWQAPAYATPHGKSTSVEVVARPYNSIAHDWAIRFWGMDCGYFDVGMGEVLEDFELVIS